MPFDPVVGSARGEELVTSAALTVGTDPVLLGASDASEMRVVVRSAPADVSE